MFLMSGKKKNVVSVRLDEKTHNKLSEIQQLLEEIYGSPYSQSDIFKQMISLYHRYLISVDREALNELQRKSLIKALSEDN
jgi:DNA-binding transcriptional regulator YbjK